MIYSVPYILFLIILFFLCLIETGKIKAVNKKFAVYIAYAIGFIFIGLRGHVMCDFINYYPFFNSLPSFQILCEDYFSYYGFEPGFCFYTWVVKSIFNNYFAWVAINAAIDLFVLFITFRRYCNSIILPLLFFFVFQGYTIEFNLYRNAKSLDLFLLSLPYLQNRNFVKYCALNLLGTLFHTSAFLYIPFYFILTKSISRYIIWSGIIAANILFLFNISIVNNLITALPFVQAIGVYDKLVGYSNRAVEVGISLGYLERTITMLLFIGVYKKLVKENSVNKIFFNSYWLYYVSFLVFYEVQVFVERIPLLFIYAYWILYPNLIDLRGRYRQLIVSIIVLLFMARTISGFSNRTMTYQNILFEIPDYEASKQLQLNEMNL